MSCVTKDGARLTGPITVDGDLNGGTTATLARRDSQTGWLSGGITTVNGSDPAKIDIASGTGQVIDNKTDPMTPVYTPVSWVSFEAVTLTLIGSAPATGIYIDENGDIVQLAIEPGPPQRRTLIFLTSVLHASGNVDAISNHPIPAMAPTLNFYDFLDLIGQVNISGNVFSANGANLLLDKSAGTAWFPGGNVQVDINDPNRIAVDATEAAASYVYTYQDGADDFSVALETSIDPSMWDDGSGTLATVGNNQFTIQVVHFSADVATPLFVEYGQVEYGSLAAAIAAVNAPVVENFNVYPLIRRAWVITRNSTTDLTNGADASIEAVPSRII